MSQSYEPSTYGPKLLRRSRTDRYIGGVCGGVAKYLNMDPTLVRILTVVVTLFTGAPVVLYLVALFFMPEEDVVPSAPPAPQAAPAPGQAGDPVWGAGGPPWAPSQGAQPTAPAGAPSDPPRREGDAS
jgi:phage shock protein C